MVRDNQPDLFQADEQSDLFGEDTPTPEYRADPDSVRAELYQILAEARAAQKLPWEPKTVQKPSAEASRIRSKMSRRMRGSPPVRIKTACGFVMASWRNTPKASSAESSPSLKARAEASI